MAQYLRSDARHGRSAPDRDQPWMANECAWSPSAATRISSRWPRTLAIRRGSRPASDRPDAGEGGSAHGFGDNDLRSHAAERRSDQAVPADHDRRAGYHRRSVGRPADHRRSVQARRSWQTPRPARKIFVCQPANRPRMIALRAQDPLDAGAPGLSPAAEGQRSGGACSASISAAATTKAASRPESNRRFS